MVRGRRRLGFEFKRTTTPALTRSMHVALEDLRLGRLVVVHAGERAFDLGPRARAVPFARLAEELGRLG